jgi:hypothetical protein
VSERVEAVAVSRIQLIVAALSFVFVLGTAVVAVTTYIGSIKATQQFHTEMPWHQMTGDVMREHDRQLIELKVNQGNIKAQMDAIRASQERFHAEQRAVNKELLERLPGR